MTLGVWDPPLFPSAEPVQAPDHQDIELASSSIFQHCLELLLVPHSPFGGIDRQVPSTRMASLLAQMLDLPSVGRTTNS